MPANGYEPKMYSIVVIVQLLVLVSWHMGKMLYLGMHDILVSNCL